MPNDLHAEYGPSRLPYLAKCPGFKNREGENKSSGAADHGILLHKALEKDTISDLEDENDRGYAQQARDYIDALLAERRPALPDIDRREARLNLALEGGLSSFGTVDRLIIFGTRAFILDFKFGRRSVVDAAVNLQAWAYSIAAMQKYPQLETVEFTFLLPFRDEVSAHTFQRAEMPEMILRINTLIRCAQEIGAIDITKVDPALLRPQPSLCEWCANQTRCPALAAKLRGAAKQASSEFVIPENMVVSADRPEEIEHLLRLAPLMENWAATIKKEALRVSLEEGVDIPNFERRERRTPRSVSSISGAWGLLKGKGIPLEDFLDTCRSVSVPQLEDLVAGAAKRGCKGKAKQELEDELRGGGLLKEESSYFYLAEKKK